MRYKVMPTGLLIIYLTLTLLIGIGIGGFGQEQVVIRNCQKYQRIGVFGYGKQVLCHDPEYEMLEGSK